MLRVAAGIDCSRVDLQRIEPNGNAEGTTLIVPFDRVVPESSSARPRVVGARRWLHGLRAAVATAAPAHGLQPAVWARIALHAYQLEPALAVVRDGASRVLLADEVGLGKTIQAGLIVSALAALGQALRVLVLVPAGLRRQWAGELSGRFGLQPLIVDAETLRQRVAGLPSTANPWLVPGLFVTSFDYVKQEEVLQALRAVVWDALVVDEAHAVAAPGTERGAAVRMLAERARRVVLVTATPHAGSDEEFSALCRVGLHAASPILLFRRTREDVGFRVDRRVRVLPVRLHDAEHRLHEELGRYVRAVWHDAPAGHRSGSRLAMLVLSKRALSSALSLATSIERRLALLTSEDPAGLEQLGLPLTPPVQETDADGADEEPGWLSLGFPGLADRSGERLWLARLLPLAREASAREAKLAALCRLLSRTNESTIVFTEYRDTLTTVARALARVASVATLHGGMTLREREEALEAFGAGTARILLATDAAGEGLNLHARCRSVVSLELPWSPRRLEQRIGRVDRIGQTRRVHALHLVARGTAEGDLLARLALKMNRVGQRVGAGSILSDLTEEAVLAAVVEGRPLVPGLRPARNVTGVPSDTVARPDLRALAIVECERLARVRSMAVVERVGASSVSDASEAAPSPMPGLLSWTAADLERRRPWVTILRATTRPDQCVRVVCDVFGLVGLVLTRGSGVLVLRVVLDADEGQALDEVLHAFPVTAPRLPRHASASQIAASLDAWLPGEMRRLHAALTKRVDARLDAVLGPNVAQIAIALRRERDILRVLTAAGAGRIQPSLFDRRAERDADDRLASLAISLSESKRRCACLEEAERRTPLRRVEPLLALIGV